MSLGEVAIWGSGGTPNRSVSEYFGDGVPWLSIADLNDGVVEEAKESLTCAGVENSSAKMVPPGTLFVAMYGSIGKLGIAGREMCTSQAIAFAKPKSELIDTRYLFHYLLSQRSFLQARGRGGTQANIGQGDLKAWPVPVPQLDEQRRIAAILDHADDLRAKRRQVLAHLDDLTQSLFHDMFDSGGVGDERPRPLAEWVDAGRPITYGILKPGPDVEGGVPYVRVADIQGGVINVGSVRRTSREIAAGYRRSVIRSGDLVMSIRGHVGRFAKVPDQLAGGNITQDSARISIEDPSTATYVRCAIESPRLQHWLMRHTRGVAVRGLNLGDLRRLPVPEVPVAARREFAHRVGQVDVGREVARRALSAADELFASLQSRAFRGEL